MLLCEFTFSPLFSILVLMKGGYFMKVVQTKDTMSDIYLDALRIRNQVFIVEQGVPMDREIDQDEPYSIHFVLYSDKKEALATLRLLPLDTEEIKLQRMAVREEARGHGLGRVIVHDAEKFAKGQGFQTIILGAQLTAVDFYKSLGYTTYGDIFVDADMDHIHMKKNL